MEHNYMSKRPDYRSDDECYKNESENNKNRQKSYTEYYLTYDVLRIIFKFLNARELNTVALVCRSWREASDKEKKQRLYPICSSLSYEEFHKKSPNNSMIRPYFGIYFVPEYSGDFFIMINSFRHDSLPKDCSILFAKPYGYIVNNTELEDVNDIGSFAILPKVNDVHAKSFVFDTAQSFYSLYLDKKLDTSRSVKSFFEDNMIDGNNSGCLILLCNETALHSASKLIESLKDWIATKNISVWGGLVESLHLCVKSKVFLHQSDLEPVCAAVAITGSGVNTWSIVIEQKCKTPAEVEKRLLLLREKVQLKKYSMGFISACCERGVSLYGKPNVESSLFRKVFPNTPLFGAFVGGEFGTNSVQLDIPKKTKKPYNKIHNEFSTIFMIITY